VTALREKMIEIAKRTISPDDPAHDFCHSYRVLTIAEKIAAEERADLTVLVPAALFHDLVNHPKDSPQSQSSARESADACRFILLGVDEYPKDNIPRVCDAIICHSFGTPLVPDSIEARILQDADALEATGAIAIMRTFASTGIMKRPFYHPQDPFAMNRHPDDHRYALDLFFTRLFKVVDHLHTQPAKRLASQRVAFLHAFIAELRDELQGS